MVDVINLTPDEQMKSFMKIKKKKLAKMLIQSNLILRQLMDNQPVKSFKIDDSVFNNMSASKSVSNLKSMNLIC